MHPVDTPWWHTLLRYPVNTARHAPCYRNLLLHRMNTPYDHMHFPNSNSNPNPNPSLYLGHQGAVPYRMCSYHTLLTHPITTRSFFPCIWVIKELYRIVCAAIMSVAICGMHFTGCSHFSYRFWSYTITTPLALTHTHTHPPTHSHTHSHPHTLTHSLTHPPTPSLTHSYACPRLCWSPVHLHRRVPNHAYRDDYRKNSHHHLGARWVRYNHTCLWSHPLDTTNSTNLIWTHTSILLPSPMCSLG